MKEVRADELQLAAYVGAPSEHATGRFHARPEVAEGALGEALATLRESPWLP